MSPAKPTKRSTRATRRRYVGIVMLLMMLWTQLAVASYACPSMLKGAFADSSIADDGAMAGCDDMRAMATVTDPDNPNLCLQHSLQGDQHADTGPWPLLSQLSVAFLVIDNVDRLAQVATQRMVGARQLTRTTAPPIAIAHCCFRI